MVAVVGAAALVLGVVAVTQALDRTEAWDAATGLETEERLREVSALPDAPDCSGDDALLGADAHYVAFGYSVQEPTGESAPPPPPDDVIRTESGVTLGRDEPYAELDSERPYMVYVVGEDDVAGYALRFALDDIAAHGGRIELYAGDGQTPVGYYTSPDGVGYPVNENGQTYGIAGAGLGVDAPDLAQVVGDGCTSGYVPSWVVDFSAESLAESRANLDLPERYWEIDVTESDGTTVVDTLTFSSTDVPDER